MGTGLLKIHSVGTPPGSILRCAGEIDLSSVAALRCAVVRSLDAGLPDIQLDLVDITFADSSAVQVLLLAHKELGRRFGRLRVTGGPQVSRLLRLLRLDGMLHYTEYAGSEPLSLRNLANGTDRVAHRVAHWGCAFLEETDFCEMQPAG